jgi:50S ribosomal protein L16 3-hydroxylase
MNLELSNFDVEGFLREYWQKKPLLIRNPWAAWSNPLQPDELAGLACEAEVESRLITQESHSWALEHGPLSESRFGRLSKGHWTLLVQAVDHHVPAVAALLEPFRFVPNWRIDDVMVSYAVEGGGVGPHFDHYDVFLVQGLGKRRWQLGGQCDHATELQPHGDLRLLATFEPIEEWILEPGDILYVPPRWAHNGIGVTHDCMTYSIGFRAPSRRDLVANWSESLVATLGDDDRYTDPNLAPQMNPGEISPRAIDELHRMVTEAVLDQAAFAEWFGRYSTMARNPEIDWQPEEPVDASQVELLLAGDVALLRNPASRFSFVRGGPTSVTLFVNGERYECAEEAAVFAERICAQREIAGTSDLTASKPTVELITELLNHGSIAFDSEA